MIQGLIGKKMRMTQVFDEDGRVVPVTVLQAGPCVVVQKKNGVNRVPLSVQLGLVETRRVKHVTKPMQGHFARAQVPPTRVLREFLAAGEGPNVGDTVKADIFAAKDIVCVTGITKGKGFQGVVRRHGFGGGRGSHGSMHHRAIGSAGSNTYPAEVLRGKKMPGRMGGARLSQRGLQVVQVDAERNLILVRGAVPGCNGNYVTITKKSFQGR